MWSPRSVIGRARLAVLYGLVIAMGMGCGSSHHTSSPSSSHSHTQRHRTPDAGNGAARDHDAAVDATVSGQSLDAGTDAASVPVRSPDAGADAATSDECRDAPDGIACDDGDACTREDSCVAGKCLGASFECGDSSTLIDISGAQAQTCALDGAGALFCWGQRFEMPSGASNGPQRFGKDSWRSVSIGTYHACGIRTDGTLWCWGSNCAGQLGDGTHDFHAEPIQVGSETDWLRVVAGGGHTCGIRPKGKLICWGGADYGQGTGCPTQGMQTLPGRWKAVATHFTSVAAIRDDGTLWRMQDPLANGGATSPAFGALVQIGTASWLRVASGIAALETCGIREDRTVACAASDAETETAVSDLQGVLAVAVQDHGCAVKADSSLWCWARNNWGQASATNTIRQIDRPIRIGSDDGWTRVSAGYTSSCGLRNGRAYCWGSDPASQQVLGRSGVDGIAGVEPIDL